MQPQFRVLLGLAGTIIVGSTVFFHFVEGWNWVDSYFFTVVTISTVGYGNFVPVTVLGKLGTTVLIFLGIGVVAVALNFFGAELVSARVAQLERKKRKKPRKPADSLDE
jgi:voltage-gated potassium channel